MRTGKVGSSWADDGSVLNLGKRLGSGKAEEDVGDGHDSRSRTPRAAESARRGACLLAFCSWTFQLPLEPPEGIDQVAVHPHPIYTTERDPSPLAQSRQRSGDRLPGNWYRSGEHGDLSGGVYETGNKKLFARGNLYAIRSATSPEPNPTPDIIASHHARSPSPRRNFPSNRPRRALCPQISPAPFPLQSVPPLVPRSPPIPPPGRFFD
jgi:hypothetical protein